MMNFRDIKNIIGLGIIFTLINILIALLLFKINMFMAIVLILLSDVIWLRLTWNKYGTKIKELLK